MCIMIVSLIFSAVFTFRDIKKNYRLVLLVVSSLSNAYGTQ